MKTDTSHKRITIASTDSDRTELLRNKTLKIVSSIPELEPEYNEDAVIREAIIDFAYTLNIIGREINLPDYPTSVRVNEHTITESIHVMKQEHARLYDLPILFSVLAEVSWNAIKMQVEPYRHNNGKWSHIVGVHQYISAFYNPENNIIYPVKISVQERIKGEEDGVYMTVTVGHFDLGKIKKKDLSTLRSPGEPEKERSHGKSSLFEVSLTELISKFNNKTTVFIKNLPDGLLSQEQLKLKRDMQVKDIQREGFEVNSELIITKVTPAAIYSNERRIVIPYTVKGIEPTAFDGIDVSDLQVFYGNKTITNIHTSPASIISQWNEPPTHINMSVRFKQHII